MKANKEKTVRLLKTARGQLDGVIKMVEEDRYCIDIANQLMASTAILKKVTVEILTAHLQHCVMHSEGEDRENKMKELEKVIQVLGKGN